MKNMDISEQKQIREELERIFALSLDLICVANMDGYFERTNPAFTKILGYTAEEFLSRPFIDFIHPEDQNRSLAEVQKLAAGKPTIQFENRCRAKDGSYRVIEWNGAPLQETNLLYATGRDITERKKVEAELNLQGEIVKNMAEGVYLVGADDGIIKYCNPKFEKMFGYKPGEMVGKHVAMVNASPEKDPKETAKAIMKILDETGEWHGEVNNAKKDGTSFWCYANCSILHHPKHGRVIVSVHADITERKKAQEAQVKLVAKLQQALADIKTLEGMISICMTCKKIRDANGEWHNMESYVTAHSKATFSHGYCPKCGGEWLEKCRKAERTLEDRYL